MDIKKKYVILVRHGERADRAGLPIIFHEKDPQLTDKGKRQAYEAGNIIKSFLKETINENIDNIKLDIFSSPFTRRMHYVNILILNLKVIILQKL